KHAIDYLTTYNRSVPHSPPLSGELAIDPCANTTTPPPCGSPSTRPIPTDPQVTGAGVTPIAGVFTLYGGTITNASVYSYSNGTGFTGDKSASIVVTFAATDPNPILTWGGHIGTRLDWG